MASYKLRLCTWNVRGVHNPIKRRKILTFLKKEHIDIALLQETHLDDAEHLKLHCPVELDRYFSPHLPPEVEGWQSL